MENKNNEDNQDDQIVTPWEVAAEKGGKIDYDKLIDRFGCQRSTNPSSIASRASTGRPPHVFLRRGVFFAHRDFNDILDSYERGDKFYLYIGRGPSCSGAGTSATISILASPKAKSRDATHSWLV